MNTAKLKQNFSNEVVELSDYFKLNDNVNKDKIKLWCDVAISLKDLIDALKERHKVQEDEILDIMVNGNDKMIIDCLNLSVQRYFREKEDIQDRFLYIVGLVVLQPCKRPKINLSFESYCTKDHTEAVRRICTRYDSYLSGIKEDKWYGLVSLYKYLVKGEKDLKEVCECMLNEFKENTIVYIPTKSNNSKSKEGNTNAQSRYVFKEDENEVFNGCEEAYEYLVTIKPELKCAKSTFIYKGKWKEYFTRVK